MSNPLTGDFDLVAQFSIDTIERILATLHQRGDAKNEGLTLLHSFRVRIPKKKKTISDIFNQLPSTPTAPPKPAMTGGTPFKTGPTYGDGGAVTTGPTYGDGGVVVTGDPKQVQGIVEVQVSTPSIALVSGSSSKVTISFQIMAHYIPDHAYSTIPEFIHGQLDVTCSIVQEAVDAKSSLLSVKIDANDLKVDFTPAPGLPLASQDLSIIVEETKTFLKTQFEPLNASLPKGIDYLRFKALPGTTPAAALMLR